MLTGDWGSGQASGLIGIAGGGATGGTEIDGVSGTAGVGLLYTDDIDAAAAIADNAAEGTIIIAAPGGATSVPVTVAQAVNACAGGNSGNAVAWKYY